MEAFLRFVCLRVVSALSGCCWGCDGSLLATEVQALRWMVNEFIVLVHLYLTKDSFSQQNIFIWLH